MPPKTNRVPKARTAAAVPAAWPKLLPFIAVAGGILLSVLGLGFVRSAAKPTRAPDAPPLATGMARLVVDQKLVDFGSVPLDIPLRAIFKLTNGGDQPLRILDQPVVEVKQGC